MKIFNEANKGNAKAILLLSILICAFSASAQSSNTLFPRNEADSSETIKIVQIQKCDPFSAETEIVIYIENECRAAITVCTPMDAVVRQWASQDLKSGKHVIKWDGRDNLGQAVTSGVYIFKVQTQHCKKVETLALLQ